MSVKKISCGGFKIDNKTIVEKDGILKAVGGEGSSVLVAHAQVEGSVIESLQPGGDPVSITLDKTAAELAEAEDVAFSLEVTYSGEPVGSTYIIPAILKNEHGGMIVIYAMLDARVFDMPGYLTIMAQGTADGSVNQTDLALTAAPSGDSSDVLIINATLDFEHAISETEYPLILDKTAQEIGEADVSILRVSVGPPEVATFYILTQLTHAYSELGGLSALYFASIYGEEFYASISADSEEMSAVLVMTPPNVLPSVTASDNGSILKVVEGVWDAVDNTFVITCTPDSADLSGTMDKTPAEIAAAVEAKMQIVAVVSGQGAVLYPSSINETTDSGGNPRIICNFMFTYQLGGTTPVLVLARTSVEEQTYSTTVYTLTPYTP